MICTINDYSLLTGTYQGNLDSGHAVFLAVFGHAQSVTWAPHTMVLLFNSRCTKGDGVEPLWQ